MRGEEKECDVDGAWGGGEMERRREGGMAERISGSKYSMGLRINLNCLTRREHGGYYDPTSGELVGG